MFENSAMGNFDSAHSLVFCHVKMSKLSPLNKRCSSKLLLNKLPRKTVKPSVSLLLVYPTEGLFCQDHKGEAEENGIKGSKHLNNFLNIKTRQR